MVEKGKEKKKKKNGGENRWNRVSSMGVLHAEKKILLDY